MPALLAEAQADEDADDDNEHPDDGTDVGNDDSARDRDELTAGTINEHC